MAEKYRVIYSDVAKEDLNGILHYYLGTYGGEAVEKIFIEIESKTRDIAKMPEAFPLLTLENRSLKESIDTLLPEKLIEFSTALSLRSKLFIS